VNQADRDAFAAFVAGRSTSLLRSAYLLVGTRDRAEDIVQSALVKTYLAWPRLRDPGALEAYTRRVLVTTAISWWRRRPYLERPGEVPDRPSQADADAMDATLDRDVLWPHLRALPPRQRAVLVCRFYEHMSLAETAETLGVSVGTVKGYLARALETLRLRLGVDTTNHPTGAAR
jgi:RNA polymerase sigma-70 factor (sigma-E family)